MENVLKTYRELKEKHPDALLLFRCGDFYETYEDDAKTVSEVLGITLTKRTGSPKGEGYMAGFPYHALDIYLPKLIRAGKRVAICDQLELPKQTKKSAVSELINNLTTNNPTKNPQTTENNMKLNINNQNNETKNQVNNHAIAPIKVAPGSVPMSPEAFRAEYPDVEDADFEEVTDNVPQKAQKEQKAAPKKKVTIKRKVTLKKKQAISEAQPAQVSTPIPTREGQGEGLLPQVQFSTYTTKRGDTAPQIIGFGGEDDPRWKAHKDAGHKYVSASYRRDLNGNKVYILLFGTRYMDVAKALAGAYNTPDVNAWHRAEDACMAIYEQAQRDGKARWEEKKQQWAEKKAEKAAQKAADEQAKRCYTKEDVAAMLNAIMSDEKADIPEDIKALLKAA